MSGHREWVKLDTLSQTWLDQPDLHTQIERLREKLEPIALILGTGAYTVPHCPGCQYEMKEAAYGV
jgi:hypothetical protein